MRRKYLISIFFVLVFIIANSFQAATAWYCTPGAFELSVRLPDVYPLECEEMQICKYDCTYWETDREGPYCVPDVSAGTINLCEIHIDCQIFKGINLCSSLEDPELKFVHMAYWEAQVHDPQSCWYRGCFYGICPPWTNDYWPRCAYAADLLPCPLPGE